MTQPGAETAQHSHARSRSRVEFARAADGKTLLARREVAYPLHVTRPFHLAEQPAGMATLYLQSVSGGLYGGDDLSLQVRCMEGAAAHVTTQSPGVVHDTRDTPSVQRADLRVARGGFLEYLPEPSLLFPGAELRSDIEARMGQDSVLMVAEGLLSHDPAHRGRPFAGFASSLTVRDAMGRLLLLDRLHLDGARHAELLAASEGMADCQATLCCLQARVPNKTLLDACRNALQSHDEVYAGASALPADTGVMVRMMAREADLLAAARLSAWQSLRTTLTGCAPAPRRK